MSTGRIPLTVDAPTLASAPPRKRLFAHVPGGGEGPARATRADVAESFRDAPRPIDPGPRALLGERFGRSLDDVRIHTGPRAAQAAARAGAEAFTVGQDIAFAHDRYDPTSSTGLELLAHEVAHTVQQEGVAAPSVAGSTPLVTSSSVLEREADVAARRAVEPGGADGSAAAALHARAGFPTLSCRAIEWTKLPGGPRSLPDGQTVEDYEPYSDKSIRFKVPKLMVPREKGPVMDAYRSTVKAGGDASGLEATIEFDGKRSRAGLWQSRASTADLNRRWLAKVSWPAAEADVRWHAAGGKKGKGFPTRNPGMVASTCDMDHIVELQLGGTNIPANIAPLESKDNQKSGREIWQTVSGIAADLRDLVPDKGKVNVILSFADVEQVGGEVPVPTTSTAPGCADCTCSQLDYTAMQGTKAAATGNRENYPVVAGGQPATFLVPPGDVPIDLRTDQENLANAEVIPGMILGTLTRSNKGHVISAVIESKPHFKRRKPTRLPIAIQGGKDELKLDAIPEEAVRRLRIQGKDPRVNFTYPYLSTGWLKLSLGDTGLRGDGQLTPSLPLLRNSPIDVHFEEGRFWGELRPDPKKMKLPIPGFQVTDSGLKVDLAPELNATGFLDFKVGKLLTGHVDAQPTTAGLWLKGDLHAHVPKLEEAKGEVEYRNGSLNGKITIKTEQLGNLPGKPTGTVVLGLTEEGVTADGKIELTLPDGTKVDLDASRGTRNAIVFTGATTFKVRGLEPIKVRIRYDGEHISGEAGTGITYKSLTGRLAVKYYDGRFSGATDARFTAGRLTGAVHLIIDPDGDLYGDGSATVVITKDISGRIGVTKPKKGDIEAKGELILPPKILLFPGKHGKGTIFERAFNIPVFGPLALQIKPSLTYEAGIGPATLDNSKVGAGFKPFAEEMDFEVWASATLSIPAYAELAAGIGIGIALSAGVASISGGVDIIGAVRIEGGVFIPFELHYKAGVFSAEAPVRIEGALVLFVRIKGYLLAEVFGVDIWNPKWDLYERKFDPGIGFLLIIPLSYASNKPFSLPGYKDFRLERPKLSPDDLKGAVRSSLGEDKLKE